MSDGVCDFCAVGQVAELPPVGGLDLCEVCRAFDIDHREMLERPEGAHFQALAAGVNLLLGRLDQIAREVEALRQGFQGGRN